VDQNALVGERITRARMLRDMKLSELAEQAHVSYSMLSKVVTGTRTAKPYMLERLAKVLNVTVEDLTGEVPRTAVGAVAEAAAALHATLLRYDFPQEPVFPVRPMAQLRTVVAEISDLRARGAYLKLCQRLPALVDELTWVAHTAPGAQDRTEAYRLLTMAYFATHALAYKHGYDVLASLAEERIRWSAAGTEDPLQLALADWTRCHSLLATGGANLAVGLQVLESTRRTLDGHFTPGRISTEQASVYGALLLREAVLAARSGDANLAWSRILHAREMVEIGARDGNARSILTAGPVNSRIVQVAVAVELDDADAAIAIARELTIPPGFSRVRASHHHIDLSRALARAGLPRAALESLLTAEKYARQQTLWHPETRTTVRQLMTSKQKPSEALRELVGRMERAGAPSPVR
jgi:transcriptional regulator with XRE-family HTH domain